MRRRELTQMSSAFPACADGDLIFGGRAPLSCQQALSSAAVQPQPRRMALSGHTLPVLLPGDNVYKVHVKCMPPCIQIAAWCKSMYS